MTVTNLASLANSVTGGWQSAAVNNTSNRYLDALVFVTLNFANTAPANDKKAYVLAYGSLDGVTFTNPASGSEGTITVVDFTANELALRHIGVVPHTTQGEVAESVPMSVASAFGGVLPPYWGLVIMNYSGAALEATGNSVSWVGVSL